MRRNGRTGIPFWLYMACGMGLAAPAGIAYVLFTENWHSDVLVTREDAIVEPERSSSPGSTTSDADTADATLTESESRLRNTPRSSGGAIEDPTPERPQPKSTRADEHKVWVDSDETLFSNEPIPLLFSMPIHVVAKMPEQQRQLISKVESFYRRAFDGNLNARNAFAVSEVFRNIRSDEQAAAANFWGGLMKTGKLDDWVGRVSFDQFGVASLEFGHSFTWGFHAGQFPFAKDRNCFRSDEPLVQIGFRRDLVSDSARDALLVLKEGDWVSTKVEIVGREDDALSWLNGHWPRVSTDITPPLGINLCEVRPYYFLRLVSVKPISE